MVVGLAAEAEGSLDLGFIYCEGPGPPDSASPGGVVSFGRGSSVGGSYTHIKTDDDANSLPRHILFLMIDDLGFNDVSYKGTSDLSSPNIDSLAQSPGNPLGTILHAQPV